MTAANCGIILSGHFSEKKNTTLPGGSCQSKGKGEVCHFEILIFAPNLKILVLCSGNFLCML